MSSTANLAHNVDCVLLLRQHVLFSARGDSLIRTSDLTNFTYGKIQEKSTWRACAPLKDAESPAFKCIIRKT